MALEASQRTALDRLSATAGGAIFDPSRDCLSSLAALASADADDVLAYGRERGWAPERTGRAVGAIELLETLRVLGYLVPDSAPTEAPVPYWDLAITETQRIRSAIVMRQFFERWRLGLNPEDLELIAWTVLAFAGSPIAAADEAALEKLDAQISAILDDDADGKAKLRKVMQEAIDRRRAAGELP